MPRRPDQREHIRRKAAELFAKQGYHGTSMSDLEQAIGLGRGALYYHIGSKEQLLHELSTLPIDQLLVDSRRVVEGDGTATEQIRELSRILIGNIAGNLQDWKVFFQESHTLEGSRRRDVFSRRESYERLWEGVIDRGTRSGELRALDPVIVKGILGLHNYAYLWLRPTGRLKPEEIADSFADLLLRGLALEGDEEGAAVVERRVDTKAWVA